MKALPFKLIVSDLDGTLLNSSAEISDENLAALKNYVAEGGLFTIATGRLSFSVTRYLARLPMNSPAILCNGAVIYDFSKETVLWQNHLPEDFKDMVTDLMHRYPDMGIEVFNDTGIYFAQQNAQTELHKRKGPITPITAAPEEVPSPWYKVILAWSDENLREVEAFISRSGFPFSYTYSDLGFIELLPENISKGKALEKLIEILGISKDEVAAVGDHLNDIDMLESAGMGIAVENAHPDLKKVADMCCCSNDLHIMCNILQLLKRDQG